MKVRRDYTDRVFIIQVFSLVLLSIIITLNFGKLASEVAFLY